MFIKGKMDVTSINYRISTTTERKLCTTCRALIGFVNSLTEYEHKNIGSDLSINVLNDHEPIFTCFAEKRNLSPKVFLHKYNQPKIKNFALSTRKETFSVTDITSRSLFKKNCS